MAVITITPKFHRRWPFRLYVTRPPSLRLARMRSAIAALLCLLAAPAEGQEPATPTRPITLLDAISLGRRQGVDAAIARLNVRAADARTGERKADLLPNISARASATHQTLNLDEFGIPGAGGLT